MAWLTSLRKKPETETEALEELVEEQIEEQAPIARGPLLTVLEPDIAGISSFRIRQFPSAEPAEEYVAGLNPDIRRSTHAFWALHDRPQVRDDIHVEALVLIRSDHNSDLVYVVSFLDLESALSFTRFEVRRGLILTNVMVYWAAFVQVREEIGGVTITPGSAPLPADAEPEQSPSALPAGPSPVEVQAEATAQRYLDSVDSPPALETAPIVEDIAAVTEPPAVEWPTPVTVPEPSAEPEPVVEDVTEVVEPPAVEWPTPVTVPEPPAAPEPVVEDIAEVVEPAAVEWSTPVTVPEPPAEPEPIAEDVAAVVEPPAVEPPAPIIAPEPATEPAPPAIEDESVLEEAYVFRHALPVKPAGELDDMAEAHEPQQERAFPAAELKRNEAAEAGLLVDETVTSYSGDEEILDSLAVAAAPPPDADDLPAGLTAEADASIADPTVEIPEVEPYNGFDIAWEVERLLRNRRWREKGDEPFNGFKSPPGRF